MADYIVKDTELTSVANAIRTAGGTNSLLSFPNGFVSAVNNISGGGSSDFSAANVTMVFSGDAGIFLPELYDFDPPIGGLTSALSIVYRAGDDQNGTYKVALYKGKLLLLSDNQYFADTVSVTGDAIYDSDYPDNAAIIISGDCTITLS